MLLGSLSTNVITTNVKKIVLEFGVVSEILLKGVWPNEQGSSFKSYSSLYRSLYRYVVASNIFQFVLRYSNDDQSPYQSQVYTKAPSPGGIVGLELKKSQVDSLCVVVYYRKDVLRCPKFDLGFQISEDTGSVRLRRHEISIIK